MTVESDITQALNNGRSSIPCSKLIVLFDGDSHNFDSPNN